MPLAPRRPCAGSPTCPHPVVRNGRCAVHGKQQDRARGTAQERGYDYQWSKYSKAFLASHPVCGELADGTYSQKYSRCQRAGLTIRAECVDHIVPMRQGGSKWDPVNHMSACKACNTWKDNVYERTNKHATDRD